MNPEPEHALAVVVCATPRNRRSYARCLGVAFDTRQADDLIEAHAELALKRNGLRYYPEGSPEWEDYVTNGMDRLEESGPNRVTLDLDGERYEYILNQIPSPCPEF